MTEETDENSDAGYQVDPKDQDSLNILPLGIVPIETDALRRARMIKSARLESVIEVFRDREAGSGQMDIEKLPQEFNWNSSPPHPDFLLLMKLALMPSYDVYSLRVQMRAHGIKVNDEKYLKLSPEKTEELGAYMKSFTRPLLLQIYGDEGETVESFADVVALFRDPDVDKARQKLQIMAGKLGIEIMDIPKFLEDYADIFLSLSYYRQCLDRITPVVEGFTGSFDDLKKSYQMRSNTHLMATMDEMQNTFTELLGKVTGRLESFERNTKDMWNNISAERFRKIEKLIKAYHTSLGGILCALTVKMDSWSENFPLPNSGGPVKRSEFIMSEMKHGLEKIRQFDAKAPSMSDLNEAA